MAQVFLGVGSNIERERYITAGLDALQGLFGELALSSVYDSAAIGFEGQPFLNLVAGVDTDLCAGRTGCEAAPYRGGARPPRQCHPLQCPPAGY